MNGKQWLKLLITQSGGRVEGIFVKEHGIMLLSDEKGITHQAKHLFKEVNINQNQPLTKQLAEFTARLTYLSFPASPNYNPEAFHKRLTVMGHTSPYNLKPIAVLVAGLSIEAVLEIVSGKSNHSGRLTSSDTRAMDDTLYYLPKDADRKSVRWSIHAIRFFRKFLPAELSTLTRNQLNLANKASAIVVSMTHEEWMQLIDARLHPNSHCELEYKIILNRLITMPRQVN
ncbi:hypothetical protein D3C78_19670 [compost metagenome]